MSMPAFQKTPKKFTIPTGDTIDLFYIGALAEELGRSTQTIRKWEIAGTIPATPFKDRSGRRLYSREHIDVVVRYAEKYHITQGASISSTSFTKMVQRDFDRLNRKYLGK